MREIKFRVYDTVGYDETQQKKKLSYGFSIQDLAKEMVQTVIESWVDNLVWQQYTGLKDKNGVEIYEGDIIDNHEEYHNKKVVNYDPHSCFYCLIDLDEYPDTLYNGEMFNQAGEGSNFSGRIEVIGNIFEGVDK